MARKLIKKQAMDEFGKLWVKTLREQLITTQPFPKRATGKLYNSVQYRVTQREDDWTLTLLSEDYLKFVDKGVSGTQRKYNTPYSYKSKKPPISVIKQWTRVKGIPEEAAYPIQNKIFRFGLKPTNVINKSIREIEYRSKWINKFEESITNEIISWVKESFNYKNT
jgi:hypothetical protein